MYTVHYMVVDLILFLAMKMKSKFSIYAKVFQ
jgi:hypothetical protein